VISGHRQLNQSFSLYEQHSATSCSRRTRATNRFSELRAGSRLVLYDLGEFVQRVEELQMCQSLPGVSQIKTSKMLTEGSAMAAVSEIKAGCIPHDFRQLEDHPAIRPSHAVCICDAGRSAAAGREWGLKSTAQFKTSRLPVCGFPVGHNVSQTHWIV
jgi:hypothetical protein